MFRTKLQVTHDGGKDWELSSPLVYEAKWEWIIVREDFVTDFASIPRPFRWLLDNAGRNSEAAVLHDAVWRESKREVGRRIDPWHADGLFRRALRQTGSTALARGVMWFAVRMTAIVGLRFGRPEPEVPVVTRVGQLLVIFLLGAVTVLPTAFVAAGGLAVYWLASWVVALVWWAGFEHSRFGSANWPWPANQRAPERKSAIEPDKLDFIPADDPRAALLDEELGAEPRVVTTDELDAILGSAS